MNIPSSPCLDEIRNMRDEVKMCWNDSTMAARRDSAIVRQRELGKLINLRANHLLIQPRANNGSDERIHRNGAFDGDLILRLFM